MGRQRIEITRILNDRNRSVTYAKRKAGLMKKAHELAALTGSEVGVIIFGQDGKLSEFCSGDMDKLLLRYIDCNGPTERRGSERYQNKEDMTGTDNPADAGCSEKGGDMFAILSSPRNPADTQQGAGDENPSESWKIYGTSRGIFPNDNANTVSTSRMQKKRLKIDRSASVVQKTSSQSLRWTRHTINRSDVRERGRPMTRKIPKIRGVYKPQGGRKAPTKALGKYSMPKHVRDLEECTESMQRNQSFSMNVYKSLHPCIDVLNSPRPRMSTPIEAKENMSEESNAGNFNQVPQTIFAVSPRKSWIDLAFNASESEQALASPEQRLKQLQNTLCIDPVHNSFPSSSACSQSRTSPVRVDGLAELPGIYPSPFSPSAPSMSIPENTAHIMTPMIHSNLGYLRKHSDAQQRRTQQKTDSSIPFLSNATSSMDYAFTRQHAQLRLGGIPTETTTTASHRCSQSDPLFPLSDIITGSTFFDLPNLSNDGQLMLTPSVHHESYYPLTGAFPDEDLLASSETLHVVEENSSFRFLLQPLETSWASDAALLVGGGAGATFIGIDADALPIQEQIPGTASNDFMESILANMDSWGSVRK